VPYRVCDRIVTEDEEDALLKGYIIGWRQRETLPEKSYSTVDVGFDHRPEKGYRWKTRRLAEADCVMFDSLGIRVPSAEGGEHICNGFQTEERANGEFVVFCEGPFILDASKGRVAHPKFRALCEI
jgi:hypothetical protein